jgi:hypothetical protein
VLAIKDLAGQVPDVVPIKEIGEATGDEWRVTGGTPLPPIFVSADDAGLSCGRRVSVDKNKLKTEHFEQLRDVL